MNAVPRACKGPRGHSGSTRRRCWRAVWIGAIHKPSPTHSRRSHGYTRCKATDGLLVAHGISMEERGPDTQTTGGMAIVDGFASGNPTTRLAVLIWLNCES